MKTYVTSVNRYPVTETSLGEVISGRRERQGKLYRVLGCYDPRHDCLYPIRIKGVVVELRPTSSSNSLRDVLTLPILRNRRIVARACDETGDFTPEQEFLVTNTVQSIEA